MSESISYTLVAILLYFASDWLLVRMELARGRRFEHRSLIFFGLLLGLALASFYFIRQLLYAGGN
jgi:hypothetical protein